ncbi:hypothetical protein PVAP13_9KG385800, partial [Panicum virgatum]
HVGFKPLELRLIVSSRFLSLSDLGSSTAASSSTSRGGGEEAWKERWQPLLLLRHLHRSEIQFGGGMGVGDRASGRKGQVSTIWMAVEPVATIGHAARYRAYSTRRGCRVSGITPMNLTCGDKEKRDSSNSHFHDRS